MSFTRTPSPIQVLDKQSSNVTAHLATFEGTISILESANENIDTASAALQEQIDVFARRIEDAAQEKDRNLSVIRNLRSLIGAPDGE